jgi:hypothetical protein
MASSLGRLSTYNWGEHQWTNPGFLEWTTKYPHLKCLSWPLPRRLAALRIGNVKIYVLCTCTNFCPLFCSNQTWTNFHLIYHRSIAAVRNLYRALAGAKAHVLLCMVAEQPRKKKKNENHWVAQFVPILDPKLIILVPQRSSLCMGLVRMFDHPKKDRPPVIKRGNGKSPISLGFNGNIIYQWCIFHCNVWLPDGNWSFHMRSKQDKTVGPLVTNFWPIGNPCIFLQRSCLYNRDSPIGQHHGSTVRCSRIVAKIIQASRWHLTADGSK